MRSGARPPTRLPALAVIRRPDGGGVRPYDQKCVEASQGPDRSTETTKPRWSKTYYQAALWSVIHFRALPSQQKNIGSCAPDSDTQLLISCPAIVDLLPCAVGTDRGETGIEFSQGF